jgi:hypothetical protein
VPSQSPAGAPIGGGPGSNSNGNDNSDSNAGLWGGVGGGVAAAAIAAAALVAFFLRRRKQAAISEPGVDDAEASHESTGAWDVEHPDQEYIEEENPFASSDDLGAVQDDD